MKEAQIKDEVRLRLGKMPDVLLYNNPVGVLTTADHRGVLDRLLTMMCLTRTGEAQSLVRATLSERPRKFRYGLCVGSSDLIGIGPGGRFLALEVKTAKGRATEHQLMFIELVKARGGCAEIVRSADEAQRVVEEMRGRMVDEAQQIRVNESDRLNAVRCDSVGCTTMCPRSPDSLGRSWCPACASGEPPSVNEVRSRVGLGPLRMSDGSKDRAGLLTVEEYGLFWSSGPPKHR